MALVRSYIHAIDRLSARESLERINDASLGSGMVKREASSRAIRQLKQRAYPRGRRRARPATKADLESMGIKVVSDG